MMLSINVLTCFHSEPEVGWSRIEETEPPTPPTIKRFVGKGEGGLPPTGRIPPDSGGWHRDPFSGSVAGARAERPLLILRVDYFIESILTTIRRYQRYCKPDKQKPDVCYFCYTIWLGSVAIISAFPRKLVILPVTHTLASRYFVSGVPNLARSLPQMRIVKTSLGYGSSRFRNVG
jgi:hypothetical protein